jgi:hypothetical protein
MSEITRYVLIDDEGRENNGYEYDLFAEARDEAIRLGASPYSGSARGYAVEERVYTFDDSSLVWTPNGADTWPPTAASTPPSMPFFRS